MLLSFSSFFLEIILVAVSVFKGMFTLLTDLDYNVKLEMYGIIQKEYAKMVFRQEACEDKIKSFVESCNACPR